MGDLGSFYRMTPFEIAVGWIFGVDEVPPREDKGLSAREAFEQVVLDALRADGPTFVTFSGGRDSSAVLAVAVDQARRHGLELPVPVTNRYPGVESADEDEWQELVIRHLGVTDWIKIDRSKDDDLLGVSAQESLGRFGLLWPPTLHTLGPLLAATKGGTVLTGEGGDEMLGPHRMTPLTGLVHRKVTPRKTAAVTTLKEMAPRAIRRRIVRTALESDTNRDWLTREARASLIDELVHDHMAQPLHWGSSVLRMPLRKAARRGLENQALMGNAHGVAYTHPFHAPSFTHSWSREGGALGYPGRTAAMKRLFENLLPDHLLARQSKAWFNAAHFGEPTRSFVSAWTGFGVDDELVDAEALQQEWLSPEPHASTGALLHAAWQEGESAGA